MRAQEVGVSRPQHSMLCFREDAPGVCWNEQTRCILCVKAGAVRGEFASLLN